MGRSRTAEEVERDHLEAFGPRLGPLYHALYNEVAWIHAKWIQYRKLYAKSEKRTHLLKDTAPFFFRVFRDVLIDDVLLHLTRLTDQPSFGASKNLTLLRLPNAVKDCELRRQIRHQVEDAKSRTKKVRKWRNKRLAHRDLRLALRDPKVDPLPVVTIDNIEKALNSVRETLNLVSRKYTGGVTAFEHFVVNGDVDALVSYLSLGYRTDEDMKERHLSGHSKSEEVN